MMNAHQERFATSSSLLQEMPVTSRPREKLLESGARALPDAELLAILIRTGARGRSAIDLARELLGLHDNSLAAVARLSVHELMAVKGLGRTKAVTIAAALELGRRRAAEPAMRRAQVSSSTDAYDLLHPSMRDLTQEAFRIILLDRRSKVIGVEEIHVGGMAAMVVDPKIIFRKALERKASAVILAHNHPSGSPAPSMEDIRLTEKVRAAGQLLDIQVLDHIIIGDGVYFSFADEGKM